MTRAPCSSGNAPSARASFAARDISSLRANEPVGWAAGSAPPWTRCSSPCSARSRRSRRTVSSDTPNAATSSDATTLPSRSSLPRISCLRSAVSIRAGYSTDLRVHAGLCGDELLGLALRRDLDHVPGDLHPPQPADHPTRRVDLPGAQTMERRARERVVVVVPRLAHRQRGEPEDVGRVILDVE